ncbi:hypothetical protein [Paenibacillus sp. FSL H7-0331]|uniref:hypothetical protein n=1 Tax=Paenibacillus sp. FSL H7-0331 TaxID=1920421 RepID=UPI002116CA99|nr:hypothetical protein [Paenibacillus sp. FSL H7-0331]
MHPIYGHHAISNSQTMTTFRALVETVVPATTYGIDSLGSVQDVGAVELGIHEYMIWELDHSLSLFLGFYLTEIPLAASTAMLLNDGAVQYKASGKVLDPHLYAVCRGNPFATLSPRDRIRVLAMLEQLDVDLSILPPPYRNDGGLVIFIVDYLNRATLFGFYSEWSAYGSTRLKTPT